VRNFKTLVFKLETAKVKNLQTWETSNLKLQSAKVKIFKLESWNFESEKLQTWNLKLRKWKSSKLRAESFQLLSFDKLQVLKLRIRTACSKLSYQSWKLLNVESCWIFKVESWKLFESCQILKLLNIESYQSWKLLKVVECWKLLNVESCWILKVVRHWKWLNVESLLIVRICCLLTSFQRRSYCTQSGIKRIKRSEELWKVIYSKRNSTSSRLLF